MAKRKSKAKERDEAVAMLEALAQRDTFWPRVAKEIKAGLSKIYYGFGRSAIPGLVTIEALHPDGFAPAGIVWYRWIAENQIDVVYSYVKPGIRRCGIRTYLHERLLEIYPHARITTNSATIDGAQWMTKLGFRFEKPGQWVFDRQSQPEKKP